MFQYYELLTLENCTILRDVSDSPFMRDYFLSIENFPIFENASYCSKIKDEICSLVISCKSDFNNFHVHNNKSDE